MKGRKIFFPDEKTFPYSVRGNEIDLSLQTAQLLLALKYVGSSAFCAIRLTKRGSEPVLRFEFNFVDSMSCLVVHDIPVEILRTELVWTEPALPSAESKTILAHPVRRIASHLDHLKGMGISEVLVRVEAEPDFAKVKFSGICDAVTVAIVVPKQPVFSPHESDAQVSLSLTGLLFILTRVANVNDACKCLLLVSEAKYMSVWLQLPNELGAIAAVTPAILVG